MIGVTNTSIGMHWASHTPHPKPTSVELTRTLPDALFPPSKQVGRGVPSGRPRLVTRPTMCRRGLLAARWDIAPYRLFIGRIVSAIFHELHSTDSTAVPDSHPEGTGRADARAGRHKARGLVYL